MTSSPRSPLPSTHRESDTSQECHPELVEGSLTILSSLRFWTGEKTAPWLDFVLLAAAGAIILQPLALYWSANPDYAFGWGVPVLAAYLFYERWLRRPDPKYAVSPKALAWHSGVIIIAFCSVWGLAFLLARLLEETVPGWRPALWLATALYVVALLTWCWLSGGPAWLRHFLFPVAFLLLTVPWPYNLEQPIVQGLMRANAALVADSLVLADIPARAAGNTLLLSTGQLGVEEACSGIRSLQSVIMISLFLGEFYSFALSRRFLFCALGILLALLGNYLRLLYLAWRGAHDGLPAVSALHDSAGLAIFVATLLGLWLINLIHPNRAAYSVDISPTPPPSTSVGCPSPRPAARWAAGLLLVAVLTEGVTQGWFAWRESSAPRLPAWTISLPAFAQPIPISAATHELLHDSESRTGAWTDASGWHWRALWFRYGPQAANRIAFAAHNPEVCLAGAGWRETHDYGSSLWSGHSFSLPIHAYAFISGSANCYVFWIARTDRDLDSDSAIVYGHTPDAFMERVLSWSRDSWLGIRGSDARSLELVLSGPTDYAAAHQACLDLLDRSLVAVEPPRAAAR